MDPIHHKNCNDYLSPGNNPNTVHLPIARGKMGVIPVVQSYWVPTKDELALLNSGGCVAFTAMGSTHPPIYMGVTPVEFHDPRPGLSLVK